MNITSRILGEAVRPPTERELMDPWWAYRYATCVIKHGRWPEGEPAIAMDPMWAYKYAEDILGGRFPEGEPAIATSPWAGLYLRSFPEAKLEWAINGLMDWTDL